MHTPSYLLKNSFGIYHLRLAVPKRLRVLFGKREIKQSLGTGNHREALRKARKLAAFYQDRFEQMGKYDDYANDPTLERIRVSIVKFPDGRIEFQNLEMDPDKPEAEALLLKAIADNIGQLPTVPAIKHAPRDLSEESAISTGAGSPITLGQLVAEYLDDSRSRCNPRTISNYTAQLQTFLEILGDVAIAKIDRKAAREAVRTLQRLPANRNKVREYRGRSINEILAMSPQDVMAPRTVELYVERIIAVFDYAIVEEYIAKRKNPFADILKDKKTRRADQERQAFAAEHLKALFDPDNRKECQGRDSRYWIPLIAAYSGMRLEEIAQLHANDIVQVDGVNCFTIQGNSGNHLKNLSAHRLVPIHSKLIDLRFLDFVKNRRGQPLFSDLVRCNDRLGHHFSKWFARYRKKCGVTAEGLTFHSFRHSVATQFKQKNIEVAKAAGILGHSVNGETYGRYGKEFTAKQLEEVVEVIDYGGVVG
jgi:integrase